MITIIAWIVFVFATIWNMLYWTVAVGEIIQAKKTNWRRETVAMLISLLLWFVPGVYLFGWL
jgi:hypothetical protein